MATSRVDYGDISRNGNDINNWFYGLPSIAAHSTLTSLVLHFPYVRRNGGAANGGKLSVEIGGSTLTVSSISRNTDYKNLTLNITDYVSYNNSGELTLIGTDYINVKLYHNVVVIGSQSDWTLTGIYAEATYTQGAHSYTTEIARTPSTCYTKGSVITQCSCGATQTTELALDPNNHAGGTEIRNAVAATCTAEGYTGDTYCKGCGAKLSSGTAIAKLAHTWVDATCTTPKTCSVCGATEGQPLGHNYVENVVPPSSTDNGYTNYTCSRCGHSYRDKYTCQIYGTVSPLNTGTVKINDGSNWQTVNYGDTITLTANAIKGYNFVQWNDGNTDNPRTVTATNSITYIAVFEEVAEPPVFIGHYRCSDIYIDEENKKIIFKSNNTITQNSDTIDTVDGWNFETIFNGQPAGVKRVEKIYIGNTLIYSAKG